MLKAEKQTISAISVTCISIELLLASLRWRKGELLLGGAMSEEELERRIRAITLEDVVSAAEELTDFSKACICAVGKTAGYKFYNKVVSGQK